jgi:hypothetical protein
MLTRGSVAAADEHSSLLIVPREPPDQQCSAVVKMRLLATTRVIVWKLLQK